MSFNIKIDLKMTRFYGWCRRKIPFSKGTPVTMATLYFLSVYVLFILLLHQDEPVKPEKKQKSQTMGVSPFCRFVANLFFFLKV